MDSKSMICSEVGFLFRGWPPVKLWELRRTSRLGIVVMGVGRYLELACLDPYRGW